MRLALALVGLVACGTASRAVDAPAPLPTSSSSSSTDAPSPPASPIANGPSCAATFAEMQSVNAVCRVRDACRYAEGTCNCVWCGSGVAAGPKRPHEAPPPGAWACEPAVCATKITAGTACVTGTHCGACAGEAWDCKNGAWVGSMIAPPP